MLLSADAVLADLTLKIKVWEDEELTMLRQGDLARSAKARIAASVLAEYRRDVLAQVQERSAA